jgi:predicted amidohydrolase YtcJ
MNKSNLILLLIAFLVSQSCTDKKTVDLIIFNANVYTIDDAFSKVSAIAIKDDIIVMTGSDNDVLSSFDATEVLDASGKPIYPGFIDGHCHFYGFGLAKVQSADLVDTRSFDEILQILRGFHERNPYVWVTGRGWDQNDWEVQEFPDNTARSLLWY